jgi:stearoyl-CoA desaturase (delta-9 desaturase)
MTPPTVTEARPDQDDATVLAQPTATWGGDTQSRKEQIALGIFIVVPFLAVAAAVPVAWGGWLGWTDIGIMVLMYWLTGHGITVGFHRLFTHRAFDAARPVQFVLGVLGSMAFQGPLLEWVGRHRLHHRHSDRDGDPHSPHAPRRRGLWGRFRAFWHAHIGWALAPDPNDLERYAPDLRKSRMLRVVSALFPLWAALGLLIPAAIGYALGGWPGALTGFLWGGLVRVFLGHHVTWSVNSVCHLWGRRPHATGDQSRNNAAVAVLSLGEGWHNNHHAVPTSARFGHRWWQADPGYWLIRLLALAGLAWSIKLPAPRAAGH